MILENKELRQRIKSAFPESFINMSNEFICYPKQNSYFLLDDVTDEFMFKVKVLEWLSREASKSTNAFSRKYHFNGINQFLGTNFSKEDMTEIYTYLGNNCNREKCIKFIKSGYDVSMLSLPI